MTSLQCNRCGKTLPINKFYKNNNTKNGRLGCCKECHIHDTKMRKYGLSSTEYNKLMSKTNCDLCNREFDSSRNKHIDHCHTTNVVRGVLCRQCNLALGHVKDDVSLLRRMINYILYMK
jgi:predicted metal-binding transcription factor (methanogenesis marker protein 9)